MKICALLSFATFGISAIFAQRGGEVAGFYDACSGDRQAYCCEIFFGGDLNLGTGQAGGCKLFIH